MDVFCKLGDNSSDFCKVGDGEKAEKPASKGTGDEIKRFWEVGDGREAGTKGFCEVGNAEGFEKKLFCDVNEAEKLVHDTRDYEYTEEGYGKKLFCDVDEAEKLVYDVSGVENVATDYSFRKLGDFETQDWVSPRISFSQDFVMSAINPLTHSNPSRVSPDRKKGEHDIKDNYSAEFEFLKGGLDYGPRDQAKGFMLPADELFFDGKLLPLPFPSIWAASDDLSLSLSCNQHRQEAEFSRQTFHNRPMARHLSFEIPKLSSSSSSTSSASYFSLRSTCGCISSPSKNSQLGTSNTEPDALVLLTSSLPPSPSPSPSPSPLPPSPSPSPSSSSALVSAPTSVAVSVSSAAVTSLSSTSSVSASLVSPSVSSTTSTTSLPSLSVTKCSTKLKDLFKSKRYSKGSSSSQLTRDNSTTSTCILPISSRTFWPFARSHSAGERKSTPSPPIPCRSNSAGESHSCSASCPKELEAIEVARLSTSSLVGHSADQGPITTVLEENPHTNTQSTMPPLQLAVVRVEENTDVCYCSADTNVDSAEITSMTESERSSGSQRFSKASGKRVVGTSGRGSPGRRRGASSSSGIKANGGKVLLRNLERCSAEKKLGRDGWRGLNRRGSFPVGARVSPVLNVAVYRGSNTPKIGLFGFNSLLSPKKEKSTEVSINWRNGA